MLIVNSDDYITILTVFFSNLRFYTEDGLKTETGISKILKILNRIRNTNFSLY